VEEHIVKVISIEPVTHNVNKYSVERPEGYNFIPGQATEIAINKDSLKDERRPFTFTGLTGWDHLEFIIKSYNDHNGVTKALRLLKPGDELILHDVWGAINYKGPGVFIAGGAGVTPFVSILRNLKHDNKLEGNMLIFSNKTSNDIILNKELSGMLGNDFINILTRERNNNYLYGRIDEAFLKEQIHDYDQHFYVCGPDSFIENVNSILTKLGASPDSLVFEK